MKRRRSSSRLPLWTLTPTLVASGVVRTPAVLAIASAIFALVVAIPSPASAQLEPVAEERGASGLELTLRKLRSGATFLHTAAHPDDEDNGLLAMLGRGEGMRTALLTLTRGDGGQNEIGPELFDAIGILRTEELLAMQRHVGAEQYFSRAYEFGYSFSVEETLEKWGKEEILEDVVRHIRTIRPDVIVMLPPRGEGGGQHHQTSGLLTKEAFRAAADPNRFPKQLNEGLRPWQALKLYSRSRVGFGGPTEELPGDDDLNLVTMDTGRFDPVLGRTYAQLGMEGRSAHKCQGMQQLRALPGSRRSIWLLEDSAIEVAEEETSIFDGVDTSLGRLRHFLAGEGEAAGFVSESLEALQTHIDAAASAFDARAPWRTLPALRAGLTELRNLLGRLPASSLSEGAVFELEHRLAPKEEHFMQAIALAHGLSVDPIADRGEVTRGSRVHVQLHVVNQSPEPVELRSATVVTPGWVVSETPAKNRNGETGAPAPSLPLPLANHDTYDVRYGVDVSGDAEYDRPYWTREGMSVDRFRLIEPDYFGLPWRPPSLRSRVTFVSGSVEVTLEEPVQYRYGGPWVGGEKQKIVSVLPLVSVTIAPPVVVFPTGADDKTRPVSVSAVYKGTEPAEGKLVLEVPEGFRVTPTDAPIRFERENEAKTVVFRMSPPTNVQTGTYQVRARAELEGEGFEEGVQTIAYDHIQTRYLFHDAVADVKALDLSVAPVRVGYVVGVGDEVPTAIRQLGAELTFLDEADLAEGDLSQFDVIMTGVRAYLNRADLRAYNHRLLEYVEAGGTMLVQYNKFEFNEAQWGPYPKEVSRNRVTVEEAPVEILVPSHPVFHSPNRITADDWGGWVQERGLYFLAEEGDPRYTELLSSSDPWEYNAGEKKGMLVEARYGDGRWIYIGLGFFRQLPAGVPSAYKLFANLLSLPKAPVPAGE